MSASFIIVGSIKSLTTFVLSVLSGLKSKLLN